LLQQIDQAVGALFQRLQRTGDDQRTLLMTFSEFGRRVAENGSKGTDHGSGSCLFVVGPGVKSGPVGRHPSLTDLTDGWYGITNQRRKVGFGMVFPHAIFSSVWYWLVAGGGYGPPWWGRTYNLALEPWTSWPGTARCPSRRRMRCFGRRDRSD
jgi:hypothetical protein